ncbi:hypothetical protein [Idiomarina ramblicola]|uniref:Uncharacterized protein n=1 Tax=Idiomarina ramblicola TaxID=263724 RepID=A0A432Z570_9GAMM|nr:hypothetical protein [Idiomarina ramblicola]RUO73036.1 hypothetical protein CWI78_00925 [Idiomarina ramblicola]
MLTLKFKPGSAIEFATHVLPEFSSFTLLVYHDASCLDELALGDKMILEIERFESNQDVLRLDVTVVFRFETEELKHWLAVSISPKQHAIIHSVRYLCRHHTSEYGKLFHQLVNDSCHCHKR